MKSGGSTPSERYLAGLCERSFLSPWSFPNVFRQPGQELCDLLVVFGEDVIIFSDKSCAFKDTGDVHLDWDRWYRRAVTRSEVQVHGAERWLTEYPSRVFVDPGCTQPLPIPLPPRASRRIHLVVVALGARDACKRFYGGGSGSLRLTTARGLDLFAAGYVHPGRNYVHILDDVTLDIIMSELDTASDFCRYLRKKEDFIRSIDVVIAAGEEELLAVYLREVNAAGEHDFVVPPELNLVHYDEGFWAGRIQHPQYIAKKVEDEISYVWDHLIEHFAKDLGFWEGDEEARLAREQALRIMAIPNRLTRRAIARGYLEVRRRKPPPGRMVFKGGVFGERPDTGFIFLVLVKPENSSGEEYRRVRHNILDAYAGAMKGEYRDLTRVIGIGLPPAGSEAELGVELFCRDFLDWSQEDERLLREDREKLGVLTHATRTHFRETEYPDAPTLGHPEAFHNQSSGQARNRRERRRLAAIARQKPPHAAP
jgi:hypothetical protein